MSNFIKHGYSSNSIVQTIKKEELSQTLASPEITARLEKFAHQVQRIAPKSDDFLYFTIIFLKSAEAAVIDDYGNNKKVGSEIAWGFFDENWKWHGNVKPHKNRNSDIFPELELKKAARNWIGAPLCVDHKSESVDGIRGIILDTYYDEKLKQVVGLCALDKINYPDLARKVSTGVVRFGSMGTGVEISVCSECGNKAKTQADYCDHVMTKSAYGEINIGLKPIEYSLVVQPAEPGAILLRTIASIKEKGSALTSLGVDDLEQFTSKLSAEQANSLDILLTETCGQSGCSVDQRKKIITAFLNENGLIKISQEELDKIRKGTEALAELARAKDALSLEQQDVDEVADKILESIKNVSMPSGEVLTSGQSSSGSSTIITTDDQGVKGTGSESSGMLSSDSGSITDSFDTGGVGPESYMQRTASLKQEKVEIASIMEDIMKEKELRQRAEQRRKIAYHFGGAHPEVEPKTFKSEDYHKYWEMDKQMHPNPKSLGKPDGMAPGDKEIKEQQKRAEDKTVQTEKKAYHFGGAHPEVEPKTFKSEDYHKYWDMDKQMHPNPKNLGGDKGMVPGDKEVKEQQKRAAYNGPRLSTKFKKLVNLDGSINKEASCFEVYAGDKLVIAATAKDIMGPELETEWEWITSKDYAKAVIAAIREEGLEKIASQLVKTAQELPEMPAAPPAEMAAPAPAAEMPPMEAEMPPMDEMSDDPKSTVEEALLDMEERIDEIRTALSKLGGGEDVDINVNVGGPVEEGEKVSLSRQILSDLKLALAESNESADELARISNSLDKSATLSRELRSDLLKVTKAALLDSSELLGETSVLLKMATAVSDSMVKTSTYSEAPAEKTAAKAPAKVQKEASGDDELVKQALELRRMRREQFLKMAMEAEEAEEAEEKEENEAHDGIGMKENAKVSDVTKDTAQTVAEKAPKAEQEPKAAPAAGKHDADQYGEYPQTAARMVAEKSMTAVNSAEDVSLSEVHELAEDEAKEEVEKHEDKMHNDALDEVKAKLSASMIQKKAEEERAAYRTKVRRAYDVAMEMQAKGMVAPTRAALDEQVDLMLQFDDKAFESFKRSVAATKAPAITKEASEGVTLNVGVGEKEVATEEFSFSHALSNLWSK